MDTIFALSTPPGRGGVAVIRVSGPDVGAVCTRFGLVDLVERRASFRKILDGKKILDEAIVVLFPKGASFTGEDVLELQLHGSLAVRNVVLKCLEGIEGCRPAEPGEFTRRALENGRMNIAEVEGLAALIDAETEAQRLQAQKVISGALGQLAARWRTDLIEALSLLEATIDFADEEVPVDVGPDVLAILERVSKELKTEIAGSRLAERIRDGVEVAIVGAPNSGKSTLLNAMAGRKAAMTSQTAGTTRDIIEVRMDLDGLPVTFLDTAGLRVGSDDIEEMGIALAIERATSADLRVFLLSEDDIPNVVETRQGDIKIWGKGDLDDRQGQAISGLTGLGLERLVSSISETLNTRAAGAGTSTHARHRKAIQEAHLALGRARAEVGRGESRTELAAEEIRSGLVSLDSLVGRFDVESVLDEIFSRFCIGK